jgi:signal transduction histidine kinase/CHASE3 domain sensor protein
MASSLDAGALPSPQSPRLRPVPLWAAFLLASAVFIAAGIMNYQATQILVANQRLHVRQRDVLLELQNLLRLALNAETGQRGYVITGRDSYLEPYESARRQLPQDLARLRDELAGDAGQFGRLETVMALEQAKLDELALSIAARRERGFEAAQAIVLTNQGKETMDRLRAAVAQMQAIENDRLDARMRQSAHSAEQAFRSVIVAGALDAALLLLLFLLVKDDARRRMLAAQRLADSRTLLRNVIDSLPVLIWLKDRSGALRMENQAARTLLGEAPRDAAGDAAREAQVIAQGKTANFEEVRATPLGERHFLSSRVPLRDHLGAVVGVCAVAADVTALKQTQLALRELNRTLEHRVQERTAELSALNQRLEDVNAQLDAYDFSVAHDLRAPLRAIHGFADALAEDHAAALDQAGRNYLARIARAAQRMEALIDDLLEYSRLSAAELPPERVDLDALAAAAREEFAAQLDEAGAELDIAPALGTVYANPLASAQVLRNLLSNAIKFRARDRRQHIRIHSEAASGGRLRLVVEDSGIGISEADARRIFQPFSRLHGVHAYPGSGIGLAIVERAVRRMHGDCGAAPVPGGGARFWIELPAGPAVPREGDAHRYSAD